jgi:ABC-2 type transport system ATP-binding protein
VLHRPALVLCDEALEGFDINAALAAKDELRARSRSGSAVLFSSHVAETVEQLCDRVLILDQGRLVRTAGRAEWDAEPGRLSPLERIYVDSTRIPSAGEGAS